MGNLFNVIKTLGKDFKDSFVITDLNQEDNPLVYVNDAFVELTGYSREEIEGHNCRFLQGPNTNKVTVKAIREAVRNRESCFFDLLNHKKDGTTFWNRLVLFPIGYSNEYIYYIGIQQNLRDDAKVIETFNSEVNMDELAKKVINPFEKILNAKRSLEYLALEDDDQTDSRFQEITSLIKKEVEDINEFIKAQ